MIPPEPRLRAAWARDEDVAHHALICRSLMRAQRLDGPDDGEYYVFVCDTCGCRSGVYLLSWRDGAAPRLPPG